MLDEAVVKIARRSRFKKGCEGSNKREIAPAPEALRNLVVRTW